MSTQLSGNLGQKKQIWVHWAIIGFMAILTLCLFNELFNPNKMLSASDQITIIGTKAEMQRAFLKDGQFAFWDRTLLGGMPTLDATGGDYVYPLGFPFNFMPVYDAFAWKMIFHIFLAGVFFYLMLLRGFSVPPIIAGMAAVFYMLNPQFFSHVSPGHDGKMYVIAFLPFMIWRLKMLLENPNLRNAAFLSIGFAIGILSSHIKMMFFVSWCLGAVWLFFSIFKYYETKNFKILLKPAVYFWVAVFAGLSLSAIQFFPAFQFVQDAQSVRGVDKGFEFSASWSMHWAEMFSLWVPEFGNWFGYYWGQNYFKLNSEYIGAVAMILAVLAFVFKPSKWRFFWLAFAIFIMLFSMGASSPGIRYGENSEDVMSVFALAWKFVFGLSKFRAVAMAMFLVSFSIILLSAFALKDFWLEEWKNWSETRLKKTKNILLGLCGGVIVVAVIFANQNFVYGLMQTLGNPIGDKKDVFDLNFQKNFIPALVGFVFIAIAVIGCVWAVMCGYLKKQVAIFVIFVLAMIDLIRVDVQFIQTQSNAQFKKVPPAVAEVLRKTQNEPYRSMFLPGLSNVASIEGYYGLESLNGYHENELARTREFRGEGPMFTGERWQMVRGINYLKPIFDRANMGYSDPISEGSNALDLANCKYIFYGTQTGQLAFVENKNVMPRIAFTNSYEVIDNHEKISEKLQNPSFDVKKVAILEQKPNFASVNEENANTKISTKWLKYTANKRIAEVEVSTTGLLRISEFFYDGWTILVDGKKVPIINSDIAFMAVEVPAGKHKVEMRIGSPYWNTALILTIPGAILLLIVLMQIIRRKKGN